MPEHRLSRRERASRWVRSDLAEMRRIPDNLRTVRRHPGILVGAIAVTVLMCFLISASLSLIGRPEWSIAVYSLVVVPVIGVYASRAVMARRSADG